MRDMAARIYEAIAVRVRARFRRALAATGIVSRREMTYRIVYADRLWGRHETERFYSGPGSLPENLGPYLEAVGAYLREHDIQSVVDLGCGDFRASRALDLGEATYLGVDVVAPLIRYNQTEFGSDRIRFEHLDLLEADTLPDADLCIVKHVLQHWSNEDILQFLPKLDRYRHVLVLNGRFALDEEAPERNDDIRTGAAFRTTGLHLDRPPFDLSLEPILTYRLADDSEEMRLIRLAR